MRLVILGAPGSGRRTQASLLAKKYQLPTLTSTELVKAAMCEENEQGWQLRSLQEAGQAVTEDIILSLLQTRLRQSDVKDGFILDGYPRNLLQALTLDEMLAEIGQPIDYVILIHIETDALMERLVGRRTCRACGATYNIYTHPSVVEDVCDACGGRLHRRNDDNEETVSNRLHVFNHHTSLLLNHYGKQEKILRVDGDSEVGEIFDRVCEVLDRAAGQFRAQQKADGLDSNASKRKSSGGDQPKKKGVTKPPIGQSTTKDALNVEAKSMLRKSKSAKPSVSGAKKKQAVVKAISKTTKRRDKSG